MEAVEKTAKHTNQLIDDIIEQQAATLQYAKSNLKWYTVELNDLLFSQPYIKQKKMGEILGIRSRTTLVGYAEKLEKLGIISYLNEGTEVYYVNNDLIRILES
jgi:hypothetical protein